ncbi:hypothetical protein [Ferrimonas marina]|uniref:Uncharacterized protein n=1 Tax=Ferrimonas marina TaxID=299255 RepID=A0A1M5X1H1_9GAMM|nr:hypothetical protein [Ferrimonas marina]SHH93324.1 hypothetical protein SAMN02745129_3129 [Ferrimonas marina]
MSVICIDVKIERARRLLWLSWAALLLLSVGATLVMVSEPHRHFVRLAELFYVGGENNLPTAFSSGLLLFSALLSFLARQAASAQDRPYWLGLTLGMVLMAMDEALEFHESLSGPVRALLGLETFGPLYFAWVLPAALLVLGLALVFFRFWWRLPMPLRRQTLLAGGIYLGGALGIEAMGGWWFEATTSKQAGYQVLVHLEEGAEMAGLLLYIQAMLVYLGRDRWVLRFRTTPKLALPHWSPG